MKKILRYVLYSFLVVLLILVGLSFLPSYRYLHKIAYLGFKANIDDYKYFSNREVKAGKAQEWGKASNYNEKPLSEEEKTYCEKYGTVALLVIQNGKIKFEKYWEKYGENSYSNSFSMAKTIVALLIGIALDEGKIKNLDQKVGEFLPEFSVGDKASMSLRDVLQMSSGLNWDEGYGNPFSEVTKTYVAESIDEIVKNLPVREPSGKTWRYQSGDTQVLGYVIEKATGKTVAAYASEKLWIPLGAKNTALWTLAREDDKERAFCCFNSNARDFARLGQLVLNKGHWNGKQIVPETYIKELTSPALRLKDRKGQPVKHYGYQLWIAYHKNLTIPCFRGVKGQYIAMIPEKNAMVIRLGHNRSNKMIRYTPEDLYRYVDMGLDRIQ